MSNEALSEQTIDYLATVLSEPVISAKERKELQEVYESLVESRQGRRRNSRWTPVGERARQGDVNALTFLEFVARQLEDRDHNARWIKATKYADSKPQSNAELQPSPLARKLRLQYSEELERMPTLQIDALWNEILLYAKMGFDSLRSRNTQSVAFATYQIPQITETPTLDFLLLSFVTTASKHPITLKEFDRGYLEEGRMRATHSRQLYASYAAILIEKASSVMEQIAKIHGIDISPKIHRKNYLLYKLEGGSFIQYFETSRRKDLDRFAAEGEASLVFYETASVVERAHKYKIPLELLITADEINALKRQAVNHPERGLRGELLDIVHAVTSGQWWEEIKLPTIDQLLGYCDDRQLVAAYQRISSAIKTLADSTYRALPPRTTQMTQEISFADEKAVKTPATTMTLPIPKYTHSQITMSESDARAILSMFESGNIGGIVSYKLQPATPRHGLPYVRGISHVYGTFGSTAAAAVSSGGTSGRHGSGINKRRIAAWGGALVAAALGLITLLPDSGDKRQTATDDKPIEVPCDDLQRAYGQGGIGYGERIGPKFVCKPGEESRIEEANPPLLQPKFRLYEVIGGDNLTHIVKRNLGIRDERAAYMTALEIARFNGIQNPDLIKPGQILFIPNYGTLR